jgi:hypothetical protein
VLNRPQGEALGGVPKHIALGDLAPGYVRAVEGPYQIVAAGRFDAKGKEKGPGYNNLTATPIDATPGPAINTGYFNLHFKNYINPDAPGSSHSYIVKGTTENSKTSTFRIIKFDTDFIQIRVTGAGLFMVEISRIDET